MTEYIERDVAIKEIRAVYEYNYPTASGAFDEFATKVIPDILRTIPTADVAPIIHCEKCERRGTELCAMHYECRCGRAATWAEDGEFCSYGERKE